LACSGTWPVSQTKTRFKPYETLYLLPLFGGYYSEIKISGHLFKKIEPISKSDILKSPQLFEIRRTPFNPFALFTFRHVFDFTVLKKGLHLHFAPAGAKKLLGRA
jgi:hypothetical protein